MEKQTMSARGLSSRRRKAAARRTVGTVRLLAFVALAVVVLSAAAYFLWPAVRPNGATPPGVVTVQPSMEGFSPSRIEARVGEPITIRLVNKEDQFHTDGGGWHQFAIDELGVDVEVPPTSTKEFTFTPSESGTFGFYCSVCCGGKDNPYMWGTLVVQE